MKPLDALFLDFDGVLVESVDIKSQAFQSMFADQPADVLARIMDYHGAHDGISRVVKLRHCYEEILGQPLPSQQLEALSQRYTQLVADAVVDAPWVPGARALLEDYHESHRLFVVSGTPEEELRDIVERRGMSAWLTAVHGSPASKTTIVRNLLAEYGLYPVRCLFIGDALADWTAASETGMAFIGRVAPGRASPFPPGTQTVSDLSELSL